MDPEKTDEMNLEVPKAMWTVDAYLNEPSMIFSVRRQLMGEKG